MRNTILATICGLSTLFFLSCAKEKNVEVSSVTITQATAEMYIGETVQLNATVLPSDATDKSLTWTSSKLSVATVSNSGLVSAIAEGTSTIMASAGGKSSTCTITVSKKDIEVSSVELNKTALELVEGESETITATVKPDDASDKTIIWSTSDASVATVSEGKIYAIKEGTATISATSGMKSATCNVSVRKKIIHVEEVNVNVSDKRLKVGEEFTLKVTIIPENANDYTIHYSSSNTNVAAVSEEGLISAKASGSAIITVEAEGKKSDITIKVFEKDLIYAMAVDWSGSDCYSTLWKDRESILNADGISFDALYFINNQTCVVAEKNKLNYPYEFYYIKDGSYTAVNTGVEANRNIVYSSAQNGNDIYALVEWVYDEFNSKRAIWKNETKLYDIGEESKMSQYSYCAFGKMFFYDGDMYVCGEIMEPVSETSKASFATLWKNGKIFKQFDVRGDDSSWGGSIFDVEIIDGKFYYLIMRSNRGWQNKIAVYDDNGKLYDLCYDAESSKGQLISYNGKLYAAILATYKESPIDRLYIFEDGKFLYSIPEVSSVSMDVMEGDLYFLTTVSRRWGGDSYQSLKVYRNDKLEYTLCEEGEQSYTAVEIKVFPGN